MGRLIAFLYGLAAYLVFFVTFLYAIGFVEGLVVPRTIDNGMTGSMMASLIVNLVLLSIFAIRTTSWRGAIQAMVAAIRAEIGRA